MDKPIPEDLSQSTIRGSFDKAQINPVVNRKPEANEFKCPVEEVSLMDSIANNPYVNIEYCESHGRGAGCKNMKTCESYLEQKEKKDE